MWWFLPKIQENIQTEMKNFFDEMSAKEKELKEKETSELIKKHVNKSWKCLMKELLEKDFAFNKYELKTLMDIVMFL